MAYLISLALSTIVIFVTSYILPGVKLAGWGTAIVVAVILGILNAFIRPLLLILTIPINILTLGLFTFVVMAFLVWLTSLIVPGFEVDNFLWCIVFAIVLTLINGLISLMVV